MSNILLKTTNYNVVSKRFEDYVNKLIPKAKAIARTQIENASGKGMYSEGTLVNSISADKIGNLKYRIGTHGCSYAKYVDKGRGQVKPVHARALYNAKWNFGPTKYARPYEGAGIVFAWEQQLKGE